MDNNHERIANQITQTEAYLDNLPTLKATEKTMRKYNADWNKNITKISSDKVADLPLLDDAIFLCDDNFREKLAALKGSEWVDNRMAQAVEMLKRRDLGEHGR